MFSVKKTGSPAYIFDLDEFASRCAKVKKYLGQIPLTYSMKANPFLLNQVPESIRHIEVCSPGELDICIQMGIRPENIIYSGVNKEAWDVEKAVAYGVDILTAESLLHVKLENEAVCKLGQMQEKRKVILRLTSGNQFGMSVEDIESIIREKDAYPGLEIYGIHHYSGTQKKMRQIKKDFKRLESLLDLLKEKYNYEPKLIEYGPGACVDYFDSPYDETDWNHFAEVAEEITAFADRYPLGIEMGRFLASSCGHYVTRVKDSKVNTETNYLILDGGIHHLRYFGQTMAMQVPPIDVVKADGKPVSSVNVAPVEAHSGLSIDMSLADDKSDMPKKLPYMLCGSLCTTADILVREVMLAPMEIGDYLIFHRCGAYSVTEGTVLFLSRTLPRIFLLSKKDGLFLARDFIEASMINMVDLRRMDSDD